MGVTTGISWTDSTWNPIRGCTRVSEGCRNCYAEAVAARFSGPGQPYEGLATRSPARWTGKVVLVEKHLTDPLRWRKPRRIFVNSMSDLFHERVPDGWVMRCMDVMAQTPHHTYQILTKRAERMRSFFTRWADLTGEDFQPKMVRGPEETRKAHPSPRGQLFAAMLDALGTPGKGEAYPTFDWMDGMIGWPETFRNIWLGVSVEDQKTADERIPILLKTPAAVRFVSYEPALGPVDFTKIFFGTRFPDGRRDSGVLHNVLRWTKTDSGTGIDWIIVGGESGPGARVFDLAWARETIRQCREAGVACFFKQAGSNTRDGYALGLDGEPNEPRPVTFSGKGDDPSEWEPALRVQEFPQA